MLPTRLEDVQEQLRATVVRLSGAEAEAMRARAELSRQGEQLHRTGESGPLRTGHARHVVLAVTSRTRRRALHAETELREAQRLLDAERDTTAALKAAHQELDSIAGAAAAHARSLEVTSPVSQSRRHCCSRGLESRIGEHSSTALAPRCCHPMFALLRAVSSRALPLRRRTVTRSCRSCARRCPRPTRCAAR